MAELNFGILDTQAPGRIAAMPQLAQEKQSQNAMQFMQLQSAVQQNQTAALQFKKLQTDEANLTRFYDEVAKSGGPTNPVDMENQMIGSKVPHYVQLGYTLKQKRLETERSRELYTAANRQPTPAAPPSAPEPGSFGADVAQREAGMDNYLVPRPVNRNAFTAAPAQSQTDALRARIDANLALGTDQGNKTAENLQKQLAELGKRYTVGRTLMGSEGTVYGTAPSEPTNLARMIAERDAMPFGRARDAMTDTIEKSTNENFQINPNTGKFEDRRQGRQLPGAAPASLAFVDPGIAEGVTPQLQASSVDEARRQAFAMNAAGLPVNIRGGGNALAAAPDVNALRVQPPAAATTTPLNPKQTQTRFETDERIRGSDSEALGKVSVDEYKQLGTAANNARKAMPGIDTAERILNAGFNTGWGTEAQAAAANILASLGVADAKNYATNAQLFLAQTRTVTNDRLLDQKGPQTDNDFKRTEEIGARLGNTADANKFLLAVNRAINNQTIEKHSFFTKWVSKNDSLKGAEQAWQDSPAGRASLFDRPELKQYAQVKPAAATTAKPTAPVKIGGNADYDKLPSGTLFIDPEGTQRRKP